MGHPLGATGAMLLGTLLDELERRNLSTGLITLCGSRSGNSYYHRKTKVSLVKFELIEIDSAIKISGEEFDISS